ncbi:MAG: peptidoglycan DD-metalloendopeptidase family protein, partial [Pseudomonadota bacterium]
LAARRRRQVRTLRAKDAALAPLLAALQRIGAQSPALLALSPGEARDTALAGLILGTLTKDAASAVAGLRADLAQLAALEAETDALAASIAAREAELATARERLIEAAEARMPDLPDLGQDAANLAALALALSGVPDALATTGAPNAPLPRPVDGKIRTGFNETAPDGTRRPGLTVAAAPEALVTTPLSGRVRLAGTLDSYGPVVIVEPEEDVLLILAGIPQPLVRAGQDVIADQALGFTAAGASATGHEEFDTDAANRAFDPGPPTLYMEIRVNGTPVDPGLWFAYMDKEKG